MADGTVYKLLKSRDKKLKQGPKGRGIKRIPGRDVLAARGGLSLQAIKQIFAPEPDFVRSLVVGLFEKFGSRHHAF